MKRGIAYALILSLGVTLAFAQFQIKWQSVNIGGVPGTGTGLMLNGSAGQQVQGIGTGTGYLGYWGFWYGFARPSGPPGSAAWTLMAELPLGGKSKNVKDGGALCYGKEAGNDTGFVYAFQGQQPVRVLPVQHGHHCLGVQESIPALNRLGKKKAVKKGSSLAYGTDGKVYATKGNNTLDWWQYDLLTGVWTQKADVPTGAKNCKEGVGSAAVKVGSDHYVYLLRGSGTYDFYRYNTATDVWDITLPTAPGGASNKPYKNGSSIAYDGGDTIYCLKGSYNEFAAYSVAGKNWVTKDPLPLVAPPGTKKKKVKDGSGMAYYGKSVYALKGGNTDEFWMFNTADQTWSVQPQLTPGSKKVKGGGALTFADANRSLCVQGQ